MAGKFNWDDYPEAPPVAFDWEAHPVIEDRSQNLVNDGKTSIGESVGRGLNQGLTIGFGDEISGGVGALTDKVIDVASVGPKREALKEKYREVLERYGNMQPKDEAHKARIDELLNKTVDQLHKLENEEQPTFSQNYKSIRDEERTLNKKASDDNPWAYGLSEVAGGVATGALLAPGAAASTLKGAASMGAKQGALSGIGLGTGEGVSGFIEDGAFGATMGGALGAAGYGIGKGIEKVGKSETFAKVMKRLSGKAKDTAEYNSARALGADKATIRRLGEGKVKEIGRGALDEDLFGAFTSDNTMLERATALKERGGQAMGEVFDFVDDAGVRAFNPLDVASKVDEALSPAYRTPINKSEWSQLDNTIDSILARGDEPIPLSVAQKLKQEIGKVAYPNGKKINPALITDKQRMAQDAYRIINKSIDEAAEVAGEVVGEGVGPALKEGKRLFGIGKGAEDLLSNKIAAKQG
jgi:hypothetical protein